MYTLIAFLFVAMETVLQDPMPPVHVPPPEPAVLSAATLDAVRDMVQTKVYDGAACTVSASSDTLGPYRAVGTYIVDQKPEIPFEKWSRRVYVGEDPQPAHGPDVIITGQPMARRQLRAIVDDKRFPTHIMEIARIIARTDGAGLGVGDVYNGDQPGMPPELLGVVAAPRLDGAPGARTFTFDARYTNGSGPVRVTVQVDGEGGLGAHLTPLIVAPGPGPGPTPRRGATPSLLGSGSAPTSEEEKPVLRPTLMPENKP